MGGDRRVPRAHLTAGGGIDIRPGKIALPPTGIALRPAGRQGARSAAAPGAATVAVPAVADPAVAVEVSEGAPVGVCEVAGVEVGIDVCARVVVGAAVVRIVVGGAAPRVVIARGVGTTAEVIDVRQVTRCLRAIHAGAPIAMASSGQVMV